MVNGNELIKHIDHIYIFDLCYLNPNVYIPKTEWYLSLYMAHIFLKVRTLQPFLKMLVWAEI